MTKVTIGILARSGGYAGLASFWQIGSRVILTPLILGKIGLEGYGVWTLLFTLSGSVNIVGASFGLTYAKFTAEYAARDDYGRLNQLIGSALLLIGGFAAVALSAIVLARDPILAVLGVPLHLRAAAGTALILVALTVLLQMSIGGVTQIVAGLQRTDLRYKSAILSSVIYFGLALLLLNRGWGLYGLATSYLVGELIATGFCWVWCRRLCPQLRISPLRATRFGLAKVLALGGRFQILHLLTGSSATAFSMLLSALLGPASLGIYQLALRLIRLGEASLNTVLAPMMPAFAHFHAEEETAKAEVLYQYGSRMVFVMALLSFGFLGVFADNLILVWTGNAYPLAAWTLQVVAPAFIAKSLTGMGTASLRGKGTVGLEVKFNLVTVIAIWGLLFPAYWQFGYRGLVLAASAGLLLGSAWFVRAYARMESVDRARYLGMVLLLPLAAICPVIVVIAFLQQHVSIPLPIPSQRWALLAEICLWGLLYTFLASISVWFLVLFRAERAALV